MAHITREVWLPVEERYGSPAEHTWTYPITEREMDMVVSSTRGQSRLHDVTLFIRNEVGEIALIRKHNYPQGAWRAPGGGIHPGEDFVAGALREGYEETSLEAELDRYVLRVFVTFTCGERCQPWITHVLTARAIGGSLAVGDPKEIEGVRWGTLAELCGPMAEVMLGTGRGLFQYRVALHREVARLLGANTKGSQ